MSATQPEESFVPGSILGPYEIQSKLGRGGMGHVYQALDRRLNRVVALKVLAGDSAGAALREAQAASALNHPNIVTVYEIGRADDVEYIAMERVEGENIARRGSRLPLGDALRYAAQVADALATAHAAGIIHRDLKPSNLMVNTRGQVKVLDFGIAKMTMAPVDRDAVTQTITQPGRVIGTFAYMSPEQAEGKEVDARSDIFSFGCVLYEMVTGHKAFEGDSSIGTIASVLAREPRPVRELTPDLPAPVVRIVENCLRKRCEDRWQSMGDVKLLIEAAISDPAVTPPARTASRAAWALIPLAAMLGAGAMWLVARHPAAAPAQPARVRTLNRATFGAGLSLAPAISRDGNLIAWASDRSSDGNLDIWVRQGGAGEPNRLTTDPADDTDPSLAPDGAHVAFRSERAGGGVYIVPTLGGDPVLFAPRGRNPRYSPDGRWIAYWEGRESGGLLAGSGKIFITEAGGGQPRQLGAGLAAALYPVWSPDSRSVVALARGKDDADADWWVLPLEGAPQPAHALAALRQQHLTRLAWQRQVLPLDWRASGILFAANRYDAGNLWELPLPPAAATQVTNGPGFHLQAASAADGALAFASLEWRNQVWSLPVDADRGTPRGDLQLLTPDEADAIGPGITRDGSRMVFRGRSMGRFAVTARDLATGKQINLVEGAEQFNPRIGGDTVVYCDVAGNIFKVGARGGPAEQVCPACGFTIGISPDGGRVAYEPLGAEDIRVLDLRTRTKSSAVTALPGNVLTAAQFSPDGKWLAFDARSAQSTAQVFVVPADAAQPVPREKWIGVTEGANEEIEPAWSPNGALLYYLSDRDGFRCIWARTLDAATKTPKGAPFAVAHFHTARRSLRRILGNGGFPGLNAVPGRLIFSFGELTGGVWLER